MTSSVLLLVWTLRWHLKNKLGVNSLIAVHSIYNCSEIVWHNALFKGLIMYKNRIMLSFNFDLFSIIKIYVYRQSILKQRPPRSLPLMISWILFSVFTTATPLTLSRSLTKKFTFWSRFSISLSGRSRVAIFNDLLCSKTQTAHCSLYFLRLPWMK